MAVESPGCRAVAYRRRHPEQTALYQVVQQHLETYLALAGEDDWDGQRVPAYVEREFRRYLECGILAYGFARARCPECGHDFLVAFSCKGRGLCPSCNARRMAETAAHLVDHVFPPLPVRQWVLSVPKRLRWYLEREPRAISAVLHILLRVIEAHLRQGSGASSQARFGAVSFIHRFGASLNRYVHNDENLPGSLASRALWAAKSAPGGLVIAASSTGSSSRPRMPVIFRNPSVFAPPLS